MSSNINDYRDTLGIFPTGVTVITTLDNQGTAVGFTANSFNSVSLEPKLVLWSLDKSASLLSTFEETKNYAIHFLTPEQIDISNTFASPIEDRFANIDWHLSENNLPILEGCAAHLECEARHCYPGGDHLIFVGEVIQYASDKKQKSLAYHLGNYAKCAPIDFK